MQLPSSSRLPINILASCFNDTSATYKFYWLLAIIESIEKGNSNIEKNELFSRMISNAWYTVNYFHLSFGKQDKLQRAIEQLREIEGITVDEEKESIARRLKETTNPISLRILSYFNRQVPHWFLSPWFRGEPASAIYRLSRIRENKSLYALSESHIILNEEWIPYLVDNAYVLKSFIYWRLAIYLQARNPSVPDIPNKLVRPAARNSLVKQRKLFWNVVLEEKSDLKCIYTGSKIELKNYAVEHFVPYAFVSHDLIWNLVPADKIFNSSKSDKLPSLSIYFDDFYLMQRTAVEIVRRKMPNNPFLQEYLTIYPDLFIDEEIGSRFEKQKLRDVVQPLITIASNNGFQFMSNEVR